MWQKSLEKQAGQGRPVCHSTSMWKNTEGVKEGDTGLIFHVKCEGWVAGRETADGKMSWESVEN